MDSKGLLPNYNLSNIVVDANNLDLETVQHLLRLGYSREDIHSKAANEGDIVGQLYRRLLNVNV